MDDDQLTPEDERFIRLFNKGFEEVVLPAIERTEENINGKMDQLESKMDSGFNRIESRLDRMADRQQQQDLELAEHLLQSLTL